MSYRHAASHRDAQADFPYRWNVSRTAGRSFLTDALGCTRGHPREEVTVAKKEVQDLKARLTVATTVLGLLDALAKLAETLRTFVR